MAEQKKSGGNAVLIIIIIVVILGGLGGGAWYWFKYLPDQEAKEKARLEQLAREKAEKEAAEREAQKKAKYDQLISNADVEFQQESWEDAKSLYSEASDLYPDESYPLEQINLINQKLAEIAEMEANRVGTIEMISSATGRYYVVLSSSIDDDLAMDFAKKLSKEKIDVKILETHADKLTYFAVSPADFDTREEAEAALQDFSIYGSGIWVVRY
jgi:cytoskeletal protein RodZ